MAEESTPIVTTSQVLTNFSGPPTVSDRTPESGDQLYPAEGPDPAGTRPGAVEKMERETPANPDLGAGVEGEEIVWEARYAMKNFLGRIVFRGLLTAAWIALAVYTWGYSDGGLAPVTVTLGIVLGLLWAALIYRILLARFGHYYRLTTRRLFVSTGLMRPRTDMMELLGVKDVFTRQALVERWLSLGTVVVVSNDKEMPIYYLTGVNDPKHVMDLVWHHARSERDRRSIKVDRV